RSNEPGPLTVSELLGQAIVTGFAVGMIYAVIAIGMLIVYSVGNVINLAHGDVMTVGMYVTIVLIGALRMPYWLTLIVCPCLGLAIGFLLELLGNRPFSRRPVPYGEDGRLLTIFISTLALSLMVEGALVILFPTQGLSTPSTLSWTVYHVGAVVI